MKKDKWRKVKPDNDRKVKATDNGYIWTDNTKQAIATDR